MADYRDLFANLDRIGVTDVLLPFFLTFTLVFAVFQKIKILGADAKKYNVIVALVVAFAVVMPHITGKGPDVVPIINNSLPSVGALAIVIIMALFLIGVFGFEMNLGGYTGLIMVLALLTVGYIFGVSAGWFTQFGTLNFLFDSDTQALIVIILVFAIVIAFITSDDSKKDDSKSFMENLNKMFQKPGGK
jgi:hypothetical protein